MTAMPQGIARVTTSAAPVSRISHCSLRTPQLDTLVTYYTDVIGLTVIGSVGDTVQLACSDGTVALELAPGDSAALDHLAFDLPQGVGIDAAAQALKGAGFTPTDWDGVVPAGAESLKLTDPDGAVVQVMSRKQLFSATTEPHRSVGVSPVKLGHVASRVDKVADVTRFYQEALGFRFSDSIGDDFIFLRCNADHHSVNLLRVGAPRHIHHLAFELQDWSQMKTAADELWSHGVPLIWGPSRHGAGHNLFMYHHDPDGNVVEFFSELDRMSDEGLGVFDWRPWHDGPQYPRKWDFEEIRGNGWGSLPPDRFVFG
jgi:catechol-2,3-dioxygenase